MLGRIIVKFINAQKDIDDFCFWVQLNETGNLYGTAGSCKKTDKRGLARPGSSSTESRLIDDL